MCNSSYDLLTTPKLYDDYRALLDWRYCSFLCYKWTELYSMPYSVWDLVPDPGTVYIKSKELDEWVMAVSEFVV